MYKHPKLCNTNGLDFFCENKHCEICNNKKSLKKWIHFAKCMFCPKTPKYEKGV